MRKAARPPSGQLLNLMSTDSERLVDALRLFNRTWTAPFVVLAGIIYIWTIIGPSVLVGVGLMFGFLPIGLKIGVKQRGPLGNSLLCGGGDAAV